MKSLRSRITVLSSVVLAVVLALAAILIVSLVDSQLRDELRGQRAETLAEVAGRIADGEDPTTLRLPLGTDGSEYAILGPDGDFVNTSIVFDIGPISVTDADGPLTDEALLLDEEVFFNEADIESSLLREIFSDTEAWEEASRPATAPDGSEYEVMAFTSINIVERSVSQVQSVLLIAIPVLALIFGGLVWFLTGRLLRPVDEITRRAAEISTDTLDQRLEEPGTNDEIDRLTKTLNTMLDRLDSGAAQQRQFVSDASHELQSPLTVLIGEAELAAQRNDPHELAAANALVVEHGKRMSVLIHDLLDLARAGETELQKSDVDLDDVLIEQAAMQLRPIDTSGVQPLRIQGEPRSLGRLFRNLTDNASRYAASKVQISCRLDGEWAVVMVDDDGPGIPVADREHIFERFARVDASRDRATGGTGLGLAIAEAIATAHNGTIVVEDSPLGGARMVVRLPG